MIFFENLFRFKKKFLKKSYINPSSNIDFGSKKSNNFFINELKKSKFYFEFGSGNSTILADKLDKNFISIELDKTFYKNISNYIKKNNKIIFVDIGPVGEFSYPLFKNKDQILKYIKSINNFFIKKKFPSLILVDGRFRVACCINIFFLIKKYKQNPIIILDDYKKRDYYKVLNKIFNIKTVGRMAILKAKKNLKINTLNLDDYIFNSK